MTAMAQDLSQIRREQVRSRRRLGQSATLMLALVLGCGPSRVLPNPEGLASELGGRKLWHTPVAYIYATDGAVAGETERWIGELDRHLQRTYERPLGKGLVIVNDSGETPCIDSFDEIARLHLVMAERMELPEDDRKTPAEQRESLEESGLSEEMACGVVAVALDGKALAKLGLGDGVPEDVEWSICCPSHRLMHDTTWKFAFGAIEREKGTAFAVATAWALPIAVPEAAKAFRLRRDLLAFELWALRQEDWPAEKRKEEADRYQNERALVISPMLSLALSMAKKKDPGEIHSREEQPGAPANE